MDYLVSYLVRLTVKIKGFLDVSLVEPFWFKVFFYYIWTKKNQV